MKPNPRAESNDNVICWLCDYGLFVLGIVLLMALIIYVRSTQASPIPYSFVTPTITAIAPVQYTATPESITPMPTDQNIQPTRYPAKPEFIIAYIKLEWSGTDQEFIDAVELHHNLFVTESQIERFFTVEKVVAQTEMEGVNLADSNLVVDLQEFGLLHVPADRYVGITDGDLALDDNLSTSGWTFGPDFPAIVAEADGPSITAHELGHTFGLCDEYSSVEWERQNLEFYNGCPNPYPTHCPETQDGSVDCFGEPTRDGRNSIMGPSGMEGGYGYNEASLSGLHNKFEQIIEWMTLE